MAISPTVQQYQQTDDFDDQTNTTTDAESLFKQKFGEAAYKVFQSKFPSLLPYVVTFKVIEVDVDNGQGIGAFIVQRGNDVIYVPIVLSEGTIESCEMFYDKVTDSIVPASKKEVDKLLATNKLGGYELTKKIPRDNTQQMFRNMFRPPVSSRPITMASSTGLENLPNNIKEKIAESLMADTALLSKIAEFYPMEVLAAKLSKTTEKIAEDKFDIPEVISIEELTKEAAKSLTDEDKQSILNKGYLIKNASEKSPVLLNKKSLPVDVITSLNLTEINLRPVQAHNQYNKSITPSDYGLLGKGTIFCTGGTYISNKTGIVTKEKFFNFDKSYEDITGDSVVISNFEEEITEEDLKNIGATDVENLKLSNESEGTLFIFYKTRSGRFRILDTYGERFYPSLQSNNDISKTPILQKIEDAIIITSGCTRLEFSSKISYGFVKPSIDISILPKETSYVYFANRNTKLKTFEKVIPTIHKLLDLFNKLGRSLKLVGDGISFSVRDSALKKEASFKNKKELITYLTTQYAFNKEAVDQFLTEKDVITFEKNAFDMSSNPYINHMADLSGITGLVPSPQTPDTPLVDQRMIYDIASMGDQDLMDTGLIASIANTQDIKVFLLDMLPTFINTVTDLGKVILLYLIKSKEFKDYYGRESYSTFLGTLRRIFTNLGDITTDLRGYTNNQ